jgi:hypothetical protein
MRTPFERDKGKEAGSAAGGRRAARQWGGPREEEAALPDWMVRADADRRTASARTGPAGHKGNRGGHRPAPGAGGMRNRS